MAHLLTLQTLADELVECLTLTSFNASPDRFKRLRDVTLQSLRNHSFLRTNQFDVVHQLSGLEERFRICHREALADVLRTRLGALRNLASQLDRSAVDFHPEVLRLLLETSDRPTHNFRLEDLGHLLDARGEGAAGAPPLTWEHIAEEDGWWQAGADNIWASADYADSSDGGSGSGSGGETSIDDKSDESDANSGDLSTLDGLEPQATRAAVDYVVSEGGGGNPEKLRLVEQSQAWRGAAPSVDALGHSRKVQVTEFQVLREALFMLQGSDTTLFSHDDDCSPVPGYQLVDISWDTYRSAIGSYSEAGRKLRALRDFAATEQTAPHFQVFRDCVVRSLAEFNGRVSAIEAALIAPERDTVVSLVAAYSTVKPFIEPLLPLSSIVTTLCFPPSSSSSSAPGPFRHLELLFTAVTAAQLAGQASTYAFLARVFLDCFAVYVRAARLWMDEGRLVPGDRLFFVSGAATRVAPARTWRDRFRLRRAPDGELHVPTFLRTEAERIFTAGKSVVILRQLGRYEVKSRPDGVEAEAEPGLDYESVCGRGDGRNGEPTAMMMMLPFLELFAGAFDRWVESKHRATSEALKRILFNECGLWAALDALESVYFMKDGAIADSLCRELFRKLDRADPRWNNRHELTMLAQEAFSSRSDDRHRLSVTVDPDGQRITPAQARDSVRKGLAAVRPHYQLSWPVQMVVTAETLPHYHAIFTLLLQLRRATTVLTADRLLLDDGPARRNRAEHAHYYGLRSQLLWFYTTLHTYVATLVLAPACAGLRADLVAARDADAIIALHATFSKRVVTEACLGSKLEPIHECILDVFDLAPRLQRAHAASAAGAADELAELSMLEQVSSPLRRTAKKRMRASRTGVEDEIDVEVDGIRSGVDNDGGMGQETWGQRQRQRHTKKQRVEAEQPFSETLRNVDADWDRGLRFITTGLRGVARASSDGAAAKWDLLAEMLETGVRRDGVRAGVIK